ncbi:MAG: polysaccharide biosynthesis/export family protein [Thermodesulforhabdaceae bacterium]
MKWLVFLLMISITGCAGAIHNGESPKTAAIQENFQENIEIVKSEIAREVREGINLYTLAPGDVLEIIYHATAEREVEDYRLRVDDKIEVEIAFHPDMNRVHVVRPDGRITLPLKGEIMAVGKTPDELAKEIATVYSDVFKKPAVTVRVQEYASKVWELRTALQTTERGQAKKIIVAPDGYVYLPYVGGVKAAGKTVRDLQEDINESYKKKFGSITVSVLLDEVKGNKVFVFGEVNRPGMFPLGYPVTVVQVLSMAGGPRRTGDLSQVKVLFWDDNLKSVVRTVNVKQISDKGKLEKEFILPKNSVVYVPKTTAAKIGEFVEDYIKNIFMFNGVSFGFSYEVKGSGN